MKNLKYLFLALVLSLALAPSSFALQCHQGNLGSDECWTNVQVDSLETKAVIAGTLLEFAASNNNADDNAYVVKVANASADYAAIAGVAQGNISAGDSGLVLVRGKGKLKTVAGAIASRDYLYTTSNADGKAGIVPLPSGTRPIAHALQSSAGDATIDAYIVIV